MNNLEARAADYARYALYELTRDPGPKAYGIDDPWASVEQWVDFELEGAAGDEFVTDAERAAIIQALHRVADLATLNAPFTGERR